MKKYNVWAGFDGKRERIAATFDTRKEAVERLNKAFTRKYHNANCWIDVFGQEFKIFKEGE